VHSAKAGERAAAEPDGQNECKGLFGSVEGWIFGVSPLAKEWQSGLNGDIVFLELHP